MGSLESLRTGDFSMVATTALAVVMAFPLVAVFLGEAYPYLRGMTAAQAVVVFTVVGGASGVISQIIAAHQLDRLPRDVNVLELMPAVAASILASAIVTYALLPPNPNPATSILEEAGAIPA